MTEYHAKNLAHELTRQHGPMALLNACVDLNLHQIDAAVLVLCRNIDKMDKDALDKWFQKQDYSTREMVYDLLYVNGDNNLTNLRRPRSNPEGAPDRRRIPATHVRRGGHLV